MVYTWPLYGVVPSFLAFWGASKDQLSKFKKLPVIILRHQSVVDEGQEGFYLFFEGSRNGREV